jgi:hypothetical protein
MQMPPQFPGQQQQAMPPRQGMNFPAEQLLQNVGNMGAPRQ